MFAFRTLNLSSLLFVVAACALPNHAAANPASGMLKPGDLLDVPAAGGTPAQEANGSLHIVVIAGHGATNMLNRDAATQPVIQVFDKNNKPVAGATVTVTAPDHGPSSVFLDGSHWLSLLTDRQGRASVVGMKPTGAGAFTLRISAAFQGQVAATVISQTNNATVDTAATGAADSTNNQRSSTGAHPGGLSTKTKVGIFSGIAAAAVVGALVALNHGGSSTTTAAAAAIPTASIGIAGTPTPGAPH